MTQRARRPAFSRRDLPLGRSGVSLLEVLFAVVAMSITMMGMAGMLAQAARGATHVSTRGARVAARTQQLNWLGALPYDTLDSQAGCVTVSTQPFPHTRCVAITNVAGGSGAKQLRLIVAPLNTSVKPDTAYLTRSLGKSVNPLAL